MPKPYSVQYRLNNQLIDNPVEIYETSIQVNFDEGTQGSIETGELTFVNDAYKIIDDYIQAGLSGGVGITEGMPIEISIQQGLENLSVFNGFLDFTNFEDLTGDPNHVNQPKFLINIQEQEGLNSLSERLEGLTFALLETEGVITQNDWQKVEYLVEKQVTFIEQALLALSIYLMIKELAEASYRLSQQINLIIGFFQAGAPFPVASIIYSIASALFEAAYVLVMASALADLIVQFTENLVSPVKEFNGIKYSTAIEKIFSYLGYTVVYSDGQMTEDINSYVYLPSKAEGREDKGIPFDSDFGFVASEFVQLVLDKFRAEIFIQEQGNKQVVNIRTKKDPFLLSQSNFVLPSNIDKSFSYNISEIKESRFISFQDDISDAYTVSNWEGTSLVVTTTPQTQNNPKNNLLKGLEIKKIPVALGNKKTELSTLEKALSAFYESANFVLNLFNKSTSNPIQDRVNMLKISQPFFSVPKVLKMRGTKLTNDYRSGLSAPYLWENYLNYDSFTRDNFNRQRKVFEGVEIPFSFDDYKKVKENSYFVTESGQVGKFTSLEWTIEADKAEVSFWIQEVYTKNLKEELTIVK